VSGVTQVASLEARFSKGPVRDRLNGKVILVTGAGSGQGQAVALLFARAGATVIASDISAKGMDATAAMAADARLVVHQAIVDAADPVLVKQWVDEAAARHGGIDVLYNNGAGVHMAPFSEMTLQQWQETLRWELDVVFLPTKAAWPHLIARGGGSVINIASASGMRGTEFLGAAAHATGKSGVIGFTRQLAVEGAPHWIRVNSISPGPIMTPPTQAFYDASAEFRHHFDGWPLLARTGRPLDVAYAGLFLASDESTFITGVNLPIDGGWTCKGGFTAHA
jgi:NAD(P)-dependent dehydrogenase (short-subunit alcohol dehydrogenase family)